MTTHLAEQLVHRLFQLQAQQKRDKAKVVMELRSCDTFSRPTKGKWGTRTAEKMVKVKHGQQAGPDKTRASMLLIGFQLGCSPKAKSWREWGQEEEKNNEQQGGILCMCVSVWARTNLIVQGRCDEAPLLSSPRTRGHTDTRTRDKVYTSHHIGLKYIYNLRPKHPFQSKQSWYHEV